MERMQNLDQYKDKDDFMNWFLTAKQDYPDTVSDNEVIGYLILTVSIITCTESGTGVLTIYFVDPRRGGHRRRGPKGYHLPYPQDPFSTSKARTRTALLELRLPSILSYRRKTSLLDSLHQRKHAHTPCLRPYSRTNRSFFRPYFSRRYRPTTRDHCWY